MIRAREYHRITLDVTRRITLADAVQLRSIRLRALQTDPLSFGSTYEREIGRTPAEWEQWARAHASGADKATFLAFRGDAVVGIAAGMRDGAAIFGLYSMWVAPEARRSGVGRTLVDAVVSWASQSGANRIDLWVTQAPAIAFYERCGFADDGRRQPLPHTPTMIEKGMSRALTPPPRK